MPNVHQSFQCVISSNIFICSMINTKTCISDNILWITVKLGVRRVFCNIFFRFCLFFVFSIHKDTISSFADLKCLVFQFLDFLYYLNILLNMVPPPPVYYFTSLQASAIKANSEKQEKYLFILRKTNVP